MKLAAKLLTPLLALAFLAPAGRAREEQSESVRFETADGVEIRGTWYPGKEGRKSACVLLLHAPGSPNGRERWNKLAQALQEDGHAVLSFDFRGHGESTEVAERFWDVPLNRQRVRGYRYDRLPTTIAQEDFLAGYHPMLANDLVAARAFVEGRNDLGECNASRLVLLGEGESAAVGLLWLASECHRVRGLSAMPLRLAADPEVKKVLCALWINPRTTLGGRRLPAVDWARLAGKTWKVPMGFVHEEKDGTAAGVVKSCLAVLRPRESGLTLTAAQTVKQASTEAPTLIRRYLNNVIEARVGRDWETCEYSDSAYFWNIQGQGTALCKLDGEKLPRLLPLAWLGVR